MPLTGGTGRLDYESFDAAANRLYIAHLGAGAVIVFDTRTNRVIDTIAGTASVRGVLAVPQLQRVYAAAHGTHDVVVIDARTDRILARVESGDVDGLAFDPGTRRVFVSDEGGGRDVAIDTRTNRLAGAVALAGEAGNTHYDGTTRHIFVAVHNRNDIAEIDPQTLRIVRRYSLPGCLHPHGFAIDERERYGYVACPLNSAIVRLNLATAEVDARSTVGIGADVLALDTGIARLYVASESGILAVFDTGHRGFAKMAQSFVGPNAHVVGVDGRSHRVYLRCPMWTVAR